MKDKLILDACCGPRMFWFDKQNPNVLYQDYRQEPKGFCKARPSCEVAPDVLMDFRKMDYKDKLRNKEKKKKLIISSRPIGHSDIFENSTTKDALFKYFDM